VWNAIGPDNERFRVTANELVVTNEEKLVNNELRTCSLGSFKGTAYGYVCEFSGKTNMVRQDDGTFRDETDYGVDIVARKFTLDQYCKSNCIVVKGILVQRNWVIEHVANSLGAAHFGSSNKKKYKSREKAMNALRAYDLGEIPASIRECLAISQELIGSDSTNELMSRYAHWKKDNPNVRIA